MKRLQFKQFEPWPPEIRGERRVINWITSKFAPKLIGIQTARLGTVCMMAIFTKFTSEFAADLLEK